MVQAVAEEDLRGSFWADRVLSTLAWCSERLGCLLGPRALPAVHVGVEDTLHQIDGRGLGEQESPAADGDQSLEARAIALE